MTLPSPAKEDQVDRGGGSQENKYVLGFFCKPHSYNVEGKGSERNTRKENQILEAQGRVATHETWQDRYRLSKQRFCWHNDENKITRSVVSSKATMARTIFAECIVSPQRDHNHPKVKCLTAPFKVKAAISFICRAAYVWNTAIIDLLGSFDDRLLRVSWELLIGYRQDINSF